MRFQNPSNDYEETARLPGLWCLLFGPLYFATRGIVSHAIASLLLAIVTAGVSWFIYPFFARQIVEKHYLRNGWIPVTSSVAPQGDSGYRVWPSSIQRPTDNLRPSRVVSALVVVVGGALVLAVMVTLTAASYYFLPRYQILGASEWAAIGTLIVFNCLFLWVAAIVIRRGIRNEKIGKLGWAVTVFFVVAIASSIQHEFAIQTAPHPNVHAATHGTGPTLLQQQTSPQPLQLH